VMQPLPAEAFASVLDEQLTPHERFLRSAARASVYADALRAADEGVIPATRLRGLIRDARRVGIDEFEAKLLISGAEFRAGIIRVGRNGFLRLARIDDE
jgi:hypothetical protein